MRTIDKLESVAQDVFDKYHNKIMKMAKRDMVDDVHEKVFSDQSMFNQFGRLTQS